jgi:hypothetical protein
MVSVQMEIEIKGDLSLANLSRELEEVNVPKEILKLAIVRLQEELMLDLCGPLYERNKDRRFSRAGTANRTLLTRHGKIQFKLTRVRNLGNNCHFKPLLVYVGVLPKQRIIDDLLLECAEIATYPFTQATQTMLRNPLSAATDQAT